MAQPADAPLHESEDRTVRNGPRFAHGPGAGRPRRPRERRRWGAWALLAVSLAMQVVGMLLPQGLLLAAGLVLAGTAAKLFVSPLVSPRRQRRPTPRWAYDHDNGP